MKSWMVLGMLSSLLLAPAASARQATLDVRLSQPVFLAGEKTKAYLKVGLTGSKLSGDRARSPVNVAIVIDKSGSMSGQKIRKAKEAAHMAVDRLDRNDIVSIIAYDSTVRVLVPATKVSDRTHIRRGIDRLSASGNTALFAGVSKGADELRKFFDKDHVNRMILLSDGQANVGPSSPGELGALGAALGREGITVTTIGLGLDYNEDLMSRLAQASDGNHAFVERADDLARFFALEFGDVLSVVAQDVNIEIECAPGVRPVRVLGRAADIVGQRISASVNQLYSGREKFILLEVEVSPGELKSERPIADVVVRYTNLLTRTDDQLQSKVRATFVSSRAEVERRIDRDVMVKAISLVATDKNRMAVKLRDEGKMEDARRMLLGNTAFLKKEGKKYKSKALKDMEEANMDDADNLAPAHWQRQRKKMRREQYRFDSQQSY